MTVFISLMSYFLIDKCSIPKTGRLTDAIFHRHLQAFDHPVLKLVMTKRYDN